MKNNLLAISLLLCNPLLAKQNFYKWTDAEGNTHYSQEKPEDKNTTEVKVNKHKPAELSPTHQAETTALKESNKKRIEDYYKKKEIASKQTIKNSKSCQQAKNYLTKFNKPVRYAVANKKTGEKTFVNDKQREQILTAAKAGIRKHCR